MARNPKYAAAEAEHRLAVHLFNAHGLSWRDAIHMTVAELRQAHDKAHHLAGEAF